MARSSGGFPGSVRIPDYHCQCHCAGMPHDTVRDVLRLTDSDRRRRGLPAEVMVCHVIAMVFFHAVSAREMLLW